MIKEINYTPNAVLEERGFTPVIFSGSVASPLETIVSEKTQSVFYKTRIGNYPIWFWTKDFTFSDELKKALEDKVQVETHGSYVKINNVRFDNITSSWEQWVKQPIF